MKDSLLLRDEQKRVTVAVKQLKRCPSESQIEEFQAEMELMKTIDCHVERYMARRGGAVA